MTSGSAIFAGKTLDLWGLGPGGDRRKSIYHKHLGTQFHAKRTDAVVAIMSKGGYNAYMKKNDTSPLDDDMAQLMDIIFLAGFDFGKANIMDGPNALRIFKLGMGDDKLRQATFDALDAGKAHIAKLIAQDAQKSADMN